MFKGPPIPKKKKSQFFDANSKEAKDARIARLQEDLLRAESNSNALFGIGCVLFIILILGFIYSYINLVRKDDAKLVVEFEMLCPDNPIPYPRADDGYYQCKARRVPFTDDGRRLLSNYIFIESQIERLNKKVDELDNFIYNKFVESLEKRK